MPFGVVRVRERGGGRYGQDSRVLRVLRRLCAVAALAVALTVGPASWLSANASAPTDDPTESVPPEPSSSPSSSEPSSPESGSPSPPSCATSAGSYPFPASPPSGWSVPSWVPSPDGPLCVVLDASSVRDQPTPEPEVQPSTDTSQAWDQGAVEQLLADAETMRRLSLLGLGLTIFLLAVIAMRARR